MKTSVPTSELLSCLADSQLRDADVASVLEACTKDEAALACWNTYHLIGDVLRNPAYAASPASAGSPLAFVGRLNRRLERETTIAAQPAAAIPHPVTDLSHRREVASNDRNFRWKLVAGVASLLAVSAIAWNAFGPLAPAAAPQLAQDSSPQIVVASPQGMVVRDARLEELLAAHRQFGAGSALRESSGFLQNAAFDAPQGAVAASGR